MSERANRWVALGLIILGIPILTYSIWTSRGQPKPAPAAAAVEEPPDESKCGEVARLVLEALRKGKWRLRSSNEIVADEKRLSVEASPHNVSVNLDGKWLGTDYLDANDRLVIRSVALPVIGRLKQEQEAQERREVIEALKGKMP